ncbi:FAD-dependent oxidoreductase, partial [Campylobacter lari]
MDVKFDIVIIGSGLGGLSAGAYLAKNGKKVLVLEQHSLIGGCATCFKRKGVLIDAGLHEMDLGEAKTDMKHLVFEKLGIKNKIEILPLPSAWSIKSKNYNLTLPHGIEKVKEVLKKEFPQECKGIDKYFNAIRLQAYS